MDRKDVHRCCVRSYRCRVDPRFTLPHRVIVHQVACLEVVRRIEHDIGVAEQIFDVRRNQIRDVWDNLNGRVEESDLALRSFRFRQRLACIGLVKEHLALQIGKLDKVAVDERELPHACPRQQRSRNRTRCPASHNCNMGLRELSLPCLADSCEQDLAGVSLHGFGAERCLS